MRNRYVPTKRGGLSRDGRIAKRVSRRASSLALMRAEAEDRAARKRGPKPTQTQSVIQR
jgi:hypothetical protein